MAIDMSQFYQVFFEETEEHLASMESLLLGLDVGAPDPEQLNAVFRAAHSIKGSSGTFGFTDLAEVTHILENLLDRIRKGEQPLQEEMIDAFLDAGDVLKSLLAAHKGEGAADQVAVEAICQRLRDLTTSGAPVPSPAPVAVAPEASPSAPAAASESGWHLCFQIDGDNAYVASAGQNLLDELVTLAPGLSVVTTAAGGEGRPWEAELHGPVDADAVRSVLDFIARSDSIRISPLGAAATANADDGAYGFFDAVSEGEAPMEAAVSDDDSFGFFEPLPEAPASDTPAGGEAYGFFEPLTPQETAAEAAPDGAKSSGEPEAYGFFEPLPAETAASTPAASAAPAGGGMESPDGAYGLFVEVPPPAAGAVPAVATTPSAPVTPAFAPENKSSKPPAPAKAPLVTSEATIRVGVDKVDQLINLVGELVITQAMLAQSATVLDPVEFEQLYNGLIQLERNSRDLQESVMSIRMMPISVVFSRFPRVVREVSQKLGKKVELKLIGEDTELDRSLIERIADPLTHLVRNSLDHGIEMPEVRAEKGKQPQGTITLKAYHQSGNIVIEVGDDGAGLNRQKILSKAKERGLAAHDQMTDQEVWLLIFEPGFSTADVITEVSGRGVGMDVVKRNIASMGGRVEIDSMLGVGTRMTVRLPLTLAILDGMSVAVGRETYIVPLGYVIESLQVEPGQMKSVSGVERLIQVRGEYLPVVALYDLFQIPGAMTNFQQGIMIVVEVDGAKAAIFVDALVGQHQVVIKSLESNYRKVAGVSGATIMGDGRVALILDVAALASMARSAAAVAA